LPEPQADALIGWLADRRIGARRWWGDGCHRQPAFAESPRTALPVTERLADSVVGLPFFVDISRRQIAEVAEAVKDFVDQAA
jgi:dTDP-4-amino-4,6-dideoxygalactose transaminase